MKLDDLNLNVNSNKVSKLLDDKFGTKVNLGSLNLRQINRLKESVVKTHAQTVRSMPFNSGHRNPEYLEQVALLEAIELRIGEMDNVEEDARDALKKSGIEVSEALGSDPELKAILDQFPDAVEGFKNGEDIGYYPDFYEALFTHYSENGEMPYGTQKARDGDPINWLSDRLNDVIGDSAPMGESEEDMKPMAMSGSQSSALLRLVGSKNMQKAKRALQLANQGKSIPANLVIGFKPIVDIVLDILQGGSSYASRLQMLDKQASGSFKEGMLGGLAGGALGGAVAGPIGALAGGYLGSKVDDEKNIKEGRHLFEGETEKAQLIMAVKDMVDRVQGMVEDLSKMKVEDLIALTDKMRDEFGQEQASAFTSSADGILSAGIDSLTNARTEMDNSVLTLTGQAPAAAPDAELGTEQPAPEAGAEMGAEMPAPEGGEEVGRELRESKR